MAVPAIPSQDGPTPACSFHSSATPEAWRGLMSRFPMSMRILIAAITALVIFTAVCFASSPDVAVFAAKGVFKLAGVDDHPAAPSRPPTKHRTANSPSSATLQQANPRELNSQQTFQR